ncbi:MAG TPA: LysR family transcriptional regulator [Aliiroseovarius sp.]|nr:LysR family transcriptional regulator [Aliiroseovarius sp.]
MKPDAITFKQLRALRAVTKVGSLAGAARGFGQTTSTVHSQIKALETALGLAVFDRRAGGEALKLTREGAEMLRAAHRIDSNLSQAVATIQAYNTGKNGRITLAVVSTGKYFGPRLVRMLADIHPEIDIRLKVANRSDTVMGIERSEFDLVIMGRPPRTELGNARPVGPHPHGIIVPPDHPLATHPGYDPDMLLSNTFIMREPGSGTRSVAERFLERFGQGVPRRMIEMDSNETIKQAVMAGLGIAMLSQHTVADEIKTGRLVLLQGVGLPVMRHWYLVEPNGPLASEVARTAAESIIDFNGSFLP